MKNLMFLVLILCMCCGSIVQGQSDSNSTVTIAPAPPENTPSNLPDEGVTTSGQFFIKVNKIKKSGGSGESADFNGTITRWSSSPTFASQIGNEDFRVYDCGKNLSSRQEFCFDVDGLFMPQLAIEAGMTYPEGSIKKNGRGGHNYFLTPEDYGVIFTPK